MANKRIEDYAYRYGVSNNEAKRRVGGRRVDSVTANLPPRGTPIAGTGKPKKGKK